MYEEYFGLSKRPFQLSPDARFFFRSEEHSRALSFLEYGVSQGDGFIVITGSVGTGKTTLVQTLLKELDPNELSVGTIVTSNLDEDDLLQMVAHTFGVNVGSASKATLLKELEHNFVQQVRANRRILIIVDEAQNLPERSVEELRMLSNFQIDGKPLVQIFLLGQQEFRSTLLSPGFEQLRQRVIATYHLNPLSQAETQTYIEHRLGVAGWTNKPQFDADAFAQIFKFCEGVPRRINNVCDRLLLYAFLEELDAISGDTVANVAEEIGAEFWGSNAETTAPAAPADTPELARASEVFDSPVTPMESMARSVFERADVQKRISALERAVDGLGHQLKPEIAEMREELSFIRLLLDDMLQEVREVREVSQAAQNPIGKKSA